MKSDNENGTKVDEKKVKKRGYVKHMKSSTSSATRTVHGDGTGKKGPKKFNPNDILLLDDGDFNDDDDEESGSSTGSHTIFMIPIGNMNGINGISSVDPNNYPDISIDSFNKSNLPFLQQPPFSHIPYKRRKLSRSEVRKAKTKAEILNEQIKEKESEVEKHLKNVHTDGSDLSLLSLRERVLLLPIDIPIKSSILERLKDNEQRLSKPSLDSTKFISWIKDLLSIPFKKLVPLPIVMDDGHVKIKEYLEQVKRGLNNAIAGQEHAKEEIVDFIARLISNPNSRGTTLALCGPKGVGKTRLVRKGVSEALKRPFAAINLGGMNDVHVLVGHDFTYASAKYGRLAQILIQTKCENPVIYLDEIDKVQSGSDKGMEIFRILTHVLDEEQNTAFQDEYFSGVDLDLSKILFIASLNNADDVDPILLDRLKIIHLNELSDDTKCEIVKNYIMPEICEQMNWDKDTIDIPPDVVRHILSRTPKEEGCRQLKRRIETVMQKLNTMRITQTGEFLQENDKEIVNEHTKKTIFVVNSNMVDHLLKGSEQVEKYPLHIYT